MKTKFPGYYRRGDADRRRLWDKAAFVFDANVILNLFKYTVPTREKFMSVLRTDGMNERIWMPHQAALEYHRNRLETVASQRKAYAAVPEILDKIVDTLSGQLGQFKRHSILDIDLITKRFRALATEINIDLAARRGSHPNDESVERLSDEVAILFDGKIGDEYSAERLAKVSKEAQDRYSRGIPPGYMDQKKPADRGFGDYIIWRQLLDRFAKTSQSVGPAIFVTDDAKDDWWLRFEGRTVGPRPELVQEFFDVTGCDFHMYSAEKFLEHASDHLAANVSAEAIEEAGVVGRESSSALSGTGHQRLDEVVNSLLLENDVGTREAIAALTRRISVPLDDALMTRLVRAERAVEQLRQHGIGVSPNTIGSWQRKLFEDAEQDVIKNSVTEGEPLSTIRWLRNLFENAESAALKSSVTFEGEAPSSTETTKKIGA